MEGIGSCLKRTQECHQILLVLLGKADIKPFVVERNHIVEREGGAVMEIWCPACESPQYRPLRFSDVGPKAGDKRASRVGGRLYLAGRVNPDIERQRGNADRAARRAARIQRTSGIVVA
jgi:hypothetical protein